jgi:arginyl-tRNA synthetase
MEEELAKILMNGISYKTVKPEKILVDFSSPNIAKELHVGHLRSTIIGDTTCKIFEFMGNEVLRVNHIGDWGTQFGMLTASLFDNYPDFMEKKPNLEELKLFYQKSKERFDSDEEFKKRSHENVVKLQSGDPKITEAWKYLCDLSRKEFQLIYDRLDIKIEEFGESFYNPFIPSTIKYLEDKGIIKMDKGAKVIFVPKQKTPLIAQKSDGGYSYDSTDLAAIRYRFLDLKCDRLIYVTDIGQELHFKLIFEAAKLAGWSVPPKTRTDHMGFGLILGEGGKKIKTREGKSEKLMDLLDEATTQESCQLIERKKESSVIASLSEEELKDSAERIGMASIKYFDLKQNRISNYSFSYKKMLDPKGDTALYLLYAYARLDSILRKVGIDQAKAQEMAKTNKIKITHEKERKLTIEILQFAEILDVFTEELLPHKLCTLIYNIASYVGEFYENCKVIGSPEQDSRLMLIAASLKMMKCIFNLLGIEPLSKI